VELCVGSSSVLSSTGNTVGRVAVGIVTVVVITVVSAAFAVGSAVGGTVELGLPVGPFVESLTTIGNIVGGAVGITAGAVTGGGSVALVVGPVVGCCPVGMLLSDVFLGTGGLTYFEEVVDRGTDKDGTAAVGNRDNGGAAVLFRLDPVRGAAA
jgi:hypothetical protein